MIGLERKHLSFSGSSNRLQVNSFENDFAMLLFHSFFFHQLIYFDLLITIVVYKKYHKRKIKFTINHKSVPVCHWKPGGSCWCRFLFLYP